MRLVPKLIRWRVEDCDGRLVVEEQSIHDATCSGRCKLRLWAEISCWSIPVQRPSCLDPVQVVVYTAEHQPALSRCTTFGVMATAVDLALA